jgi:dTDP-4-amino-4,6-dideoxygalactose transaminase
MAIDGGIPVFDEPRLTGAPNTVDRERLYARLDDMFDRHRFTNNGPMVREFESRLEALTGADHVVTVANGTLALLVASVGMGARGSVIVPSWTFAGTVQPLLWAGLQPLFVDVDPLTHSIDARALEAAAGENDVGLIVPVHLWGRPCDVDAIGAAARRLDCPVLYDAAHALGATHDGRSVGTFGSAEIFSFHATKWMTSIEGGAIATSDDELADLCRRLRNFGFAGEGDIPVNGINAKMSEMHAAVGLCQLERFDSLQSINRERFDIYRACFDGHEQVRLVPVSNGGASPHGYVVVEVTAPGEDPALELQRTLEAENVHVRRYFSPGVHRLQAFERFAPPHPLPATELLSTRCLSLPTGEAVSPNDVLRIGGLVLEAIERLSRRHVDSSPAAAVLA